MDQHLLHLVVIDLALLDEIGDKGDCTQLTHQRRIEADFTDAIKDVSSCNGYAWADEWIDMDNHHIACVAVVNQRENGRISHIAAIPVVLSVDRDRLEQCRHTG
ncbi:hypothetical protein D3C85_873870 [compost metagenome]